MKPKPTKKKSGKVNPFLKIEADLGAVINLMAASKRHADRPLRDLHRTLLPAIATRQFRLVRDDDGQPVAYLSWANVSPEVEEKLQKGDAKLLPSEWRSGKTGMLIDLVCESQDMARAMVDRLKREVFPNTVFKARRKGPNEPAPTWKEITAPGLTVH